MNTYRVHVYFKACASFDVNTDAKGEYGQAEAEIRAKKWVKNLSTPLLDITVTCDDKPVHIEDVLDDVLSVDVEEEPYEKEESE